MTASVLVVRPSTNSPRNFDIVNRVTGAVVEGGFSNRGAAEDYLWKEYDATTGEAK